MTDEIRYKTNSDMKRDKALQDIRPNVVVLVADKKRLRFSSTDGTVPCLHGLLDWFQIYSARKEGSFLI